MKGKGVILVAILVTGLLVLFLVVKKEETQKQAAIVGLEAPELVVSDPSGKAFTLAELRGSVVFVNFWASWCQPCRDEMPSIQALYNQFRNDRLFRMVTVLYRDEYPKASAYLQSSSFDLPVYIDADGRSARSYGVTGVPETCIIDKKGVLKEKVIGPSDWNSPQAVAFISNLMKE